MRKISLLIVLTLSLWTFDLRASFVAPAFGNSVTNGGEGNSLIGIPITESTPVSISKTSEPWLLNWRFYALSVLVILIGLLVVMIVCSGPALPDRYCKHAILGDECPECSRFGRHAG